MSEGCRLVPMPLFMFEMEILKANIANASTNASSVRDA
jgi:hypothetical protein